MNADAAQFIMRGLAAIGAGIAILGSVGPGISEGLAASSALGAIARNPDAYKKIRSTLILGCALTETSALYSLLVAIFLVVFGVMA